MPLFPCVLGPEVSPGLRSIRHQVETTSKPRCLPFHRQPLPGNCRGSEGLLLIERTVLTAQQAGVEELYIVTGYREQQVESFLAQLAQRRRLKVQFIRNDEWEHKENGVSILKAKNYIEEDFVLLMSDHIFEESTLKYIG